MVRKVGRSEGFTLIELMIVVAVVATQNLRSQPRYNMAAGLLFPQPDKA